MCIETFVCVWSRNIVHSTKVSKLAKSPQQNSSNRVWPVVRRYVAPRGDRARDRASVILRQSMEIVYFANTPRPLPRVTEPSSVSVSPRFRLQLGLLVHLGRCLGAPNQTERDGITRVKEGEEETRGRKEKRVRKRNPARNRKKRETWPIRAKLI